MADLLFVWIGLNQTSKSVANVYVAMQLNPKQTNWRSAIQWYFSWQSKLVLNGSSNLSIYDIIALSSFICTANKIFIETLLRHTYLFVLHFMRKTLLVFSSRSKQIDDTAWLCIILIENYGGITAKLRRNCGGITT